ncbi:hypothetical protein NPIL_666741, partial [Nephila pilipes]
TKKKILTTASGGRPKAVISVPTSASAEIAF